MAIVFKKRYFLLAGRGGAIAYAPILIVSMFIMFARTLVAARLLDIPEFGKFSAGVLLSNSFSMLSCLGFYLLLQRDLPMLIATGRDRRGLVILNQTLLLAMACFLALLPLSFAGIFSVSPEFFVVSLLNGLAQQVFLVVTLQSRSQGRAMRFACDNLLRALGIIVAISMSAWLTGAASSMILAEALVTLAMSLWIYIDICRDVAARFSVMWVASIKSLRCVRWSNPLSLLAVSAAAFLMLNGDRWTAASLLNHRDFAMYSFAGVVLVLAQSLQSVINVSVFPNLARTYAVVGKKNSAFKAIQFSIVALIVFIFLSVVAYFPVGYATKVFFPRYEEIQEFLALFLVLASFRMSDFLTSYLIIAGRERRLLIINIFAIIFPALLWSVYFDFDFSGVSAISIALLALVVSVINFLGCFFSVIIFLRSAR